MPSDASAGALTPLSGGAAIVEALLRHRVDTVFGLLGAQIVKLLGYFIILRPVTDSADLNGPRFASKSLSNHTASLAGKSTRSATRFTSTRTRSERSSIATSNLVVTQPLDTPGAPVVQACSLRSLGLDS